MPPFSRRGFVGLFSATLCAPGLLRASAPEIGLTLDIRGTAMLTRASVETALAPAMPLHEGDSIATAETAFATLELYTRTRIFLGPQSNIMLDRFVADLGGDLRIGGPMVFDRDDSLPKLDLTLRHAFGQIGVRGTRFFAGPSNGAEAVFVQRGAVAVTAGGVTRQLAAGDGVSLPGADQPPTEVAQWGQARIDAAFASVGISTE